MTRWIPLAFVLVFFGCNGDSKRPPVTPPDDGPDTTPPAAISDLAVTATTDSSATLTWTAPGDDGTTGTATRYDLAYSHLPVTGETWSGATHPWPLPAPLPAGSLSSYTVTGIPPGATYYFAFQVADEEYNLSPISNVASAAVGPDAIPPDQLDPRVVAVTDSSVTLSWTATGDDWSIGTAAQYDVRYATELDVIRAHWDDATQGEGEPAPSLAGTTDSFTVTGLQPGTSYAIGIKAGDERPNWSQLSLVEARTSSATDAHWSGLFDANGMDREVASLASYHGSLIAGGRFLTAGGVQAPGIASWNGSSWSAMGRFQQSGGAWGPRALTVYGDALVAGGFWHFLTNDDGSSGGRYLSLWRDGKWSWLGGGVSDGLLGNTECTSLLAFGNELIVGGHFQKAGTVAADNVAAWNGQSWRALHSGLNDEVFSLSSHGGRIIAGGHFGRSGGRIVQNIALLDASSGWYSMGGGVGGGYQNDVYALTVFNGDLIAAGDFAFVDGVWVRGVGRRHGPTWGPLGVAGDGWDNEYPRAWALTVYNGRLIIGGDYSERHHSCIATWDGSSWGQLGTGVGGPGDTVLALAVHDGKLFVGGTFPRAGDKVSRNIACWED